MPCRVYAQYGPSSTLGGIEGNRPKVWQRQLELRAGLATLGLNPPSIARLQVRHALGLALASAR